MTEVEPLKDFLLRINPGSQGPDWTWYDEAYYLWATDRLPIERLMDSIQKEGQKEPVLVGDDGRLWDGHHRVVALMRLKAPSIRSSKATYSFTDGKRILKPKSWVNANWAIGAGATAQMDK